MTKYLTTRLGSFLDILIKLVMKKVSLEASSKIKGGWTWEQHLGCALLGVAVGAGVGGAAGYVGCLLITPSNGDLFK